MSNKLSVTSICFLAGKRFNQFWCPLNQTGSSSAFHFYTSIGYGMLLSRLYQTPQSSGVMTSLDGFVMADVSRVLKDALAVEEGDFEKDGVVIGYSLALSTAAVFSTNDQKARREEIMTFRETLFNKVFISFLLLRLRGWYELLSRYKYRSVRI